MTDRPTNPPLAAPLEPGARRASSRVEYSIWMLLTVAICGAIVASSPSFFAAPLESLASPETAMRGLARVDARMAAFRQWATLACPLLVVALIHVFVSRRRTIAIVPGIALIALYVLLQQALDRVESVPLFHDAFRASQRALDEFAQRIAQGERPATPVDVGRSPSSITNLSARQRWYSIRGSLPIGVSDGDSFTVQRATPMPSPRLKSDCRSRWGKITSWIASRMAGSCSITTIGSSSAAGAEPQAPPVAWGCAANRAGLNSARIGFWRIHSEPRGVGFQPVRSWLIRGG